MDIEELRQKHNQFKEKSLANRFFKHSDVMQLIDRLPDSFTQSELGKSVEGRAIKLLKWGNGSVKVMLWSQMHGDEATGTMALFDLFNFLQSDNGLTKLLAENCELFFIPMVNPDGAEIFTRRNSQQIDINRDYNQTLSTEAKILKSIQEEIKPHFGFNLHDQNTLWSVDGENKPATLSFLAPAIDKQLTINLTREKAILVIADIFKDLNQVLPDQIGLFDDEFEPRAFGDNFQKNGTSTILIEAGGYQDDFEKQEIRTFYFYSILSGLQSIATESYKLQTTDNYFKIPKNNKQLFHLLVHKVDVIGTKTSVGINYEEVPNQDGCSTSRNYSIQDIGDLSNCNGYQIIDAELFDLVGSIQIFKLANFQLLQNNEVILAFENGKLLQNV